MGSQISDWAEATGPIYMGANTQMEFAWTMVAAAMCLIALVVGIRHEHASYRKIK